MLTLFVNIYFYKEEEIEIVPFTHPSNSVYFMSGFRILKTISAAAFVYVQGEEGAVVFICAKMTNDEIGLLEEFPGTCILNV